MYDLILASASPRRLELLRQIGLSPRVLASEIPEARGVDEGVLDYSRRVALEKALAGWDACGQDPNVRVLGADTEVVLDEMIFGKPADASDAMRMLRLLSGRTHRVPSSVAIVGAGFSRVLTQVSEVTFGPLSDADIHGYIASGEVFGKAGAYAIQGHAARFIERLDGSHSGVMGLPLYETGQLLIAAEVL